MINHKFFENIGLVSCSSRFNFGDVLYGKIAELSCRKFVHVTLNGMVCKELKHNSISITDGSFNQLNYLGGEMFPKPLVAHYKSESLIKYIYHNLKSKMPFSRYPEDFFGNSEEYAAHAIGMQRLNKENTQTINYLKNFRFLGVRDILSFDVSEKLNLNPVFVPDLGFTCKKIFNNKNNKNSVIAIHLNSFQLKSNENKVIDLLVYLKRNNIKFNIISLASCRNHDDRHKLILIAKKFNVEYVEINDVDSGIRLLSSVDGYIGNSFHGGVVAAAYGANVIWLKAHGQKMDNLAKTYNLNVVNLNNETPKNILNLMSTIDDKICDDAYTAWLNFQNKYI